MGELDNLKTGAGKIREEEIPQANTGERVGQQLIDMIVFMQAEHDKLSRHITSSDKKILNLEKQAEDAAKSLLNITKSIDKLLLLKKQVDVNTSNISKIGDTIKELLSLKNQVEKNTDKIDEMDRNLKEFSEAVYSALLGVSPTNIIFPCEGGTRIIKIVSAMGMNWEAILKLD